MRVVLSQMNAARELAITQRRNFRVSFTGGNLVKVTREDVAGDTATAPTSILFEGGLTFLTVASLGDTPDGFCNGAVTAVSFPTAKDGADGPPDTTGGAGMPAEVKFTPDGTFVNERGNTLNGTVFVALTKQPTSARAVTVMGSTGRVRGYRWDGHAWRLV